MTEGSQSHLKSFTLFCFGTEPSSMGRNSKWIESTIFWSYNPVNPGRENCLCTPREQRTKNSLCTIAQDGNSLCVWGYLGKGKFYHKLKNFSKRLLLFLFSSMYFYFMVRNIIIKGIEQMVLCPILTCVYMEVYDCVATGTNRCLHGD